MAAHLRWRFEDPYDSDPETNSYTFPINPNQMSSPFPEKAISAMTTTAIGGVPLVWQGNTPPKSWTFGGEILDAAHYEALRSWTYDRNRRLYLFDHFGRRLILVMQSFDPAPKRAVGRYWRHTYTCTALVLSVGAPTVAEVPA